MKARISVLGIRCGAVFLAALASCALAGEPRHIESAFESTTARITAMPDAQGVPVEWTYTNHWDFPLAVERFEQSCGCLSGEPGKADLEAVPSGKTGTIRASFTPGAHRGLLRKSLHVRFIGHDRPVELVVEASIPSGIELSMHELVWKAGEKPGPQIIEVNSGTGKVFAITGLLGVSERLFSIKREVLAEGRHYRLHITPVEPLVGGIHCLQIRTDSSDPRERVLAVFLRIEPAVATGADATSALSTKES
jgi:hypothetical protein